MKNMSLQQLQDRKPGDTAFFRISGLVTVDGQPAELAQPNPDIVRVIFFEHNGTEYEVHGTFDLNRDRLIIHGKMWYLFNHIPVQLFYINSHWLFLRLEQSDGVVDAQPQPEWLEPTPHRTFLQKLAAWLGQPAKTRQPA